MRFYFDFVDGNDVLYDGAGLDLSSITVAPKMAALTLLDMAKGFAKESVGGDLHSEFARQLAVRVRDSDGSVLQVRLMFAVEVQATND